MSSPADLPAAHDQTAVDSDVRTRLHLRDGSLLILESWTMAGKTLVGRGVKYDAERVAVLQGNITVETSEVAVVITNERDLVAAFTALGIVTIASVVLTAVCLAVPKACFGSCPTFYVPKGGAAPSAGEDAWTLQAEGFSAAIAANLEGDDLDDLPDAVETSGELHIEMRNEALETHAIRRLSVLAVDGPEGTALFRDTSGAFHALGPQKSPTACSYPHAGCDRLGARDDEELFSPADGEDLATRDTLTLSFEAPRSASKRAGLVLTARNSLLTTYVLYHLIALHGRSYPELLQKIESGDGPTLLAFWQFEAALGNVDVEVRQGESPWRSIGSVRYMGPIARSTFVLPFDLESADAPVEARIRMVGANYRIDAVALAPIVDGEILATEIAPEVRKADGLGVADAESRLRGQGRHLVTLPGDRVRMAFRVPPRKGARAYFLKSRGYYYEWMRDEWLKEENIDLGARYMNDPRAALRALAPEYKKVEPMLESIFRASRFTRKEGPR